MGSGDESLPRDPVSLCLLLLIVVFTVSKTFAVGMKVAIATIFEVVLSSKRGIIVIELYRVSSHFWKYVCQSVWL